LWYIIDNKNAGMVALAMQSIRKYFLVGMICTTLFLAGGCEYKSDSSLFLEKSWDVGDCNIHERIVKIDSWPDATFQRTYWIIRNGSKLSVGSYENESSVGIIKEPYTVNEHIIIPTSCYVYLVEPDNHIKIFAPYKAEQWWDYATPMGINGHYDYHVDTVKRIDGGWKLSYLLESGLNGKRPQAIHFVTKDNWQSFQILQTVKQN
jgi:hypothetical protein